MRIGNLKLATPTWPLNYSPRITRGSRVSRCVFYALNVLAECGLGRNRKRTSLHAVLSPFGPYLSGDRRSGVLSCDHAPIHNGNNNEIRDRGKHRPKASKAALVTLRERKGLRILCFEGSAFIFRICVQPYAMIHPR
ncbi:hypothetical protein EVAR_47542_1 [Eumeta japonica]|uniref:Uncharacterized protein n=1 Tax=Eumeta variegata TaxID=151549 RepID=A0A4C1WRY5_EUMVA|nr:hypothetical protein EVAR_47542_1 [Eumeta japonica]